MERPMNKDVKEAIVLCIIILATLLVYVQCIRHDFLYFDDHVYIYENPMVLHGLTLDGFKWAFTTIHSSNWHPLTWLSHMLDVELFRYKPGLHHISGLFFHVLAAATLFSALLQLTRSLWAAAFAAALFALHPMHVESVAWVSERKDVLSTFFIALALLAYAWHSEKPGWRRYLAVFSFYVLSLLSKQMYVTFPFLLLLLDYWPLGRMVFPRPGEGGTGDYFKAAWSCAREKIPLFALAFLLTGVIYWAQSRGGSVAAVGETTGLTIGFRIQNSLVSYATYALKVFWPYPMSPIYPILGYPTAWAVAASSVFLALVTAAAFWLWRRAPWFLVGWLWFMGTLVPVIGFVQLGFQRMADRYTYFPYIGLFLILGWGAKRIAERAPGTRKLIALAGVAAVCLAAAATHRQAALWKNTGTLFSHSAQVIPGNYVAHGILAEHYRRTGDTAKAVYFFEEACKVPNNYRGFNDYGAYFISIGKYKKALQYLERSVRLYPFLPNAWNNLGVALKETGRPDEAVIAFQKAVELSPEYFQVIVNLGKIYLEKGELEKARERFETGMRKSPFFAGSYTGMGRLLLRQGELDKAMEMIQKSLSLNSYQPEALLLLGEIWEKKGDPLPAWDAYRTCYMINPWRKEALKGVHRIESDPALLERMVLEAEEKVKTKGEHPNYLYNLATLYSKQGKLDLAVATYREATGKNPRHLYALNDLTAALLMQGKAEDAKAVIRQVVGINPNSMKAYYNLGCALALEGDTAGAVAALERAASLGFQSASMLRQDEQLAALQGNPRFEALVSRLEAAKARGEGEEE
jgi:tetratricopeptide (TPR) repeat protein